MSARYEERIALYKTELAELRSSLAQSRDEIKILSTIIEERDTEIRRLKRDLDTKIEELERTKQQLGDAINLWRNRVELMEEDMLLRNLLIEEKTLTVQLSANLAKAMLMITTLTTELQSARDTISGWIYYYFKIIFDFFNLFYRISIDKLYIIIQLIKGLRLKLRSFTLKFRKERKK